jgi:hypothetical protein
MAGSGTLKAQAPALRPARLPTRTMGGRTVLGASRFARGRNEHALGQPSGGAMFPVPPRAVLTPKHSHGTSAVPGDRLLPRQGGYARVCRYLVLTRFSLKSFQRLRAGGSFFRCLPASTRAVDWVKGRGAGWPEAAARVLVSVVRKTSTRRSSQSAGGPRHPGACPHAESRRLPGPRAAAARALRLIVVRGSSGSRAKETQRYPLGALPVRTPRCTRPRKLRNVMA